jgi:sigma-B regulation protein RsbU (phosphoserine phosphatase)
MEPASPAPAIEPASLVVIEPGGRRERVAIDTLPFLIGRQPGSSLIIRDSRVSRVHARIVAGDGGYVVEDSGSRHGTWVNGTRVTRHTLANSDRIEFGVEDSYQLVFAPEGAELKRLLAQMAGESAAAAGGLGGNLAKLRAILDLARTVQNSLSVDDVLVSVVDTALAITGAERGFLLLGGAEGLDTRVARSSHGHSLEKDDLRVPRQVIQHALRHRRELLSMNFDPLAGEGARPQGSIADLELRSVICVPLVRIRTGHGDVTSVLSTANETVGVLYMDSRAGAADMAGGNRELLQTLAIEASTVLENARLLEEERAKQRMDEELGLARSIQQSLLPRSLPSEGWMRAAGSSAPSREVGGDYFDLARVDDRCWSAVVADVSGKGTGSALLASLLQGAMITDASDSAGLARRMERLNRFLLDRTGGEKYATIFYCLVEACGRLSYVNAAHCPPLLVNRAGGREWLDATGMPVGLVEGAEFELAERRLSPGDKVVIYTDGVTEAQNPAGEFFGRGRLVEAVGTNAAGSCGEIHADLERAVGAFTEGAPQSDDITVLVIEFQGEAS